MGNNTVTFKSNTENYWKEKYGLKPNTFRKVDSKDGRFQMLNDGDAKYIVIENADIVSSETGSSTEYFMRVIKDRTYWDDYVIISWDEKDVLK